MLYKATAELLSAVSPPLSQRRLGGSAALFNLGMSLPCQAPTIFLPQFVADPSPKPPSLTHFGICVSVSVWVLAFMFVFQSGFRAVFVFQYGFWRLCLCFGMDFRLVFGLCLHFRHGFRPLFAFRAGFLLVVLNLLVSIWVAHISTLFF